MNQDDLKDPKVRAFIINAIVNGLKTNIKTLNEREDFTFSLIDIINEANNGAFVHGDLDGVLIEDIAGDCIGTILIQKGIIKFRSFIDYDHKINEEHCTILSRSVFTAIGHAAQWHSDRDDFHGNFHPAATSVEPASGYLAGGPEIGCEWDDDGFGIT